MGENKFNAAKSAIKTPVLAICPDCAHLGRCRLGIPANYELPPRGQKCPYTGKSRAYWEQRIYPHVRNQNDPEIKAGWPTTAGANREKPVILGDVICAYLRGGYPSDYEI